MDSSKITQLAKLLRESGDKVLNDRYKLTLSDQLLQTLGTAFRVILDDGDDELAGGGSSKSGYHYGSSADTGSHFKVVSRYHNAEMGDLQLIYDFVQKTRILCVTSFARQQRRQQPPPQPPSPQPPPADNAGFVQIRINTNKLCVHKPAYRIIAAPATVRWTSRNSGTCGAWRSAS